MQLSDEELNIIQSEAFIITKVSALDKIWNTFSDAQQENWIKFKNNNIVKELNMKPGKVSKGEKYEKVFPYVVLDSPALFSKKDIFTFRSVAIWGQGFTIQVQVHGAYKKWFLERFSFEAIEKLGYFIATSNSPWNYLKSDGFFPLKYLMTEELPKDYLKLAKFYAFEELKNFKELHYKFVEEVLKVLDQ